VKRAVERSLGADDSSFHQISSIMEYCGYASRFGFRVEKSKHYGSSIDDLQWLLERNRDGMSDGEAWDRSFEEDEELQRALSFLKRHDPRELLWIDASRSALEFSQAREFVAVLRCETLLRRLKVIGQLDVMLERGDRQRAVIEMRLASSGQLALISSLLFLITEAGRAPLILVDEPENSLHPSWQREYVDKLMTAMAYRDATLIVATHAPLVVTGALNDHPGKISVFAIRDSHPTRLDIDASASPSSIEEILWEAFEVVTPANHFVSEEIVKAISRYESDEIAKDDVLELITTLEVRSFDKQQQQFFEAVRKLLDKVERTKAGIGDGEDSVA
jgi:predicted ATPase